MISESKRYLKEMENKANHNFNILFEHLNSYQEFEKIVVEYFRNKLNVLPNLKYLQNILNILEKVEEKSSGEKYFLKTNFYRNLLYLYRWTISKGFLVPQYKIDSEYIHKVFEILKTLGIPDYIITEVRWALPFQKKIKKDFYEDYEKMFWRKHIFSRYPPQKDIFIEKEIINTFLIYHIGLRLFISKNSIKIGEFEEKIIITYISIVDKFPFLEHLFGVTIETDMEIILNAIHEGRK